MGSTSGAFAGSGYDQHEWSVSSTSVGMQQPSSIDCPLTYMEVIPSTKYTTSCLPRVVQAKIKVSLVWFFIKLQQSFGFLELNFLQTMVNRLKPSYTAQHCIECMQDSTHKVYICVHVLLTRNYSGTSHACMKSSAISYRCDRMESASSFALEVPGLFWLGCLVARPLQSPRSFGVVG